MNRKEYLQLCTGIVGGLGISGVVDAAKARDDQKNRLSKEYLVKGLTGMAQIPRWWFDAHWGAAVVAGYYLCKENNLGSKTVQAIQGQLDKMIAANKSQFAPLPQERPDKRLIERVPKTLGPAIKGGIRAGGHAVIFSALSIKALRDVPEMAQPRVIRGLTRLNRAISKSRQARPDGEGSYANTQVMVEATFDSIARFKGVLGRPSVKRPNFTHMITHTDALMTLESLGYPNLVKAGHAGHSVHISPPVPEIDPKIHPKVRHMTLADVMQNKYWENERHHAQWEKRFHPTRNRNGHWLAAGHLFKFLYSLHRLSKKINNKEKTQLCSAILLERYFNPDVQGG